MDDIEQEGLLGFNWEADDVDFFGLSEASGQEPIVKKPEEKEEEVKKVEGAPVVPETKVKEEEEATSFFDAEEELLEGDEGDEGKTKRKSSSIYSDVFKDLKEQGIFKHVETEEGVELDADKLYDLQQEEYEAEVSARLTAWATQDLDDDAKAFIKFKRDGGNTQDFFKTYSATSPKGDISDEAYQDKIIRHQLRKEGWDSDEVEDRLKYLTGSGGKEKAATRYNEKIQEEDNIVRQETLKSAELQKDAIKGQEQEFRENIKNVLDTTKEVKGVKITDKDKTELYNFMTKKAYKVSDTKSITGFQKKLGEAFQDSSKMILLAKLINSDFDMKDLEKATITKKTKQIKSNLEQRKGLRPTNSGSSLDGNSLADLFN